MSKPTDIEVLSGILADFPTDARTIDDLQVRLARLLAKERDRTVDLSMETKARILSNTLIDLATIVRHLEDGSDASSFITAHYSGYDDIPF